MIDYARVNVPLDTITHTFNRDDLVESLERHKRFVRELEHEYNENGSWLTFEGSSRLNESKMLCVILDTMLQVNPAKL